MQIIYVTEKNFVLNFIFQSYFDFLNYVFVKYFKQIKNQLIKLV